VVLARRWRCRLDNPRVRPTELDWTILIPVKATSRGKSRLDVPADLRPALARAMALDTVAVAAQCAAVLAVVEDPADAEMLAQIPGVQVHITQVVGLNNSIRDGLAVLRDAAAARVTPAVAILPADLPGLIAADLVFALSLAARYPFAVVPDRQETGTTLLCGADMSALVPLYGVDSYLRHQQAGAVPLSLPALLSVRHDIDMVADFDSPSGPLTMAVLDRIAARCPSP